MAKISVIIPCFNVENYLDECVMSVINQSLKDIEIILVNDGSVDKTLKIIRKYEKKDNRVKVIDQKNQGLSASRNHALELATGEYIIFLDSDDYISEGSLEEIYDKASKNKLDVLYYDADSFFESEKLEQEKGEYKNYYKRKEEYSEVYSGQQLFSLMRNKGEYRASACMQAVKLDFIKNNKIKFIEGIIHEDECYSLEVCLYAKKASHLKKNIYMRRMRDDSIMTSTKSLKRSFGYFKTITSIATYIDSTVEEEYFNYFYNYIRSLQKSSVKYFIECNNKKEISNFIDNLSYMDRYFYKLMIETLADSEKKLKDKDNEIKKLNEKLKKQNSIKYLLKQRIKNKVKKIEKFIKKDIKISVIIPVYNCEKYLKTCLDSLMNQTLKEIEIICVDDESSDKSYSILKEYAKKDNRFRIYKQKHSNAGNARNLGMKKARGKYLLFLDSDDYFDKNLCLKTYTAAKNNNAEIVLFSAVKVNEQTKEKEKVHVLLDKAVVPLNEIYSSDSIAPYLYKSSSSAPWSKLFEKKFIDKNNIKFQSLPNSNDVFFTRLSFSLAKRFYAIDEKLVNYRVNHGTNTQACKHREPLAFINAYLKLKKELEKRNLFDKYYQSYLNTLFCEITYNYNSTNTEEAKMKIVKYLKDKGLKELGIDNFDKKLIYEEKKYNDFCKILDIK